jgi:hypothetical protein
VEDDQVFTRLLRERIRAADFWNLGVSGYSTDQELLLFRSLGPEIDPDLVLLMLVRNDFEGNVTRA